MKLSRLIFALVLLLVLVSGAFAQTNSQLPQGGFPDSIFYGRFRKFVPSDNIYHPFYAWDATIGLNATLFRKGSSSAHFFVDIDTIGGAKTTSKIIVDGAGYGFGADYTYDLSDDSSVSVAIRHNSFHTTTDLLAKAAEEKLKKKPIPPITNRDLNVVSFDGNKTFSKLPFRPRVELRLQPLGFRFRGGHYAYKQPVYLQTEATLWHGYEKRIVVETQHEFGQDSFNYYTARLELYARNQEQGRFQLFFGGSPGENLHVSPNVGWHRDGQSFGVILYFHAK